MEFHEQSLDLNLNYFRRGFIIDTEELPPYAAELSALLTSLQWVYEEICDTLAIAPHDLEVLRVQHPNMSISLQGLAEPITALRDLLMAVPEFVANVWTIPDRVREKRAEFRANAEYQNVIKDVLSEYRNVPQGQRVEYFKRAFGYRFTAPREPRGPWSIGVLDAGVLDADITQVDMFTQGGAAESDLL